LAFLDETGFLMLPTVRRTWGLRGRSPILRHRMNHWAKVSAIGAVTVSPKRRQFGFYLHLHPRENISQETVIAFLRDLRRHLGGPIVVVWDRWSVHRGRRVRSFLEGQGSIGVEWLPPYAPDLNPVDKGWAWMKSHRLANHGLAEVEQLTEAVAEAHQVARGRQQLLHGFVRATGLPICP
jgi:transposase